jgi:hypothetical protein
MGGNLIARAILDGDQTWRQFTPFELVWAGGVIGRAAGQIRVWAKRLRAAIDERRAKARELAHFQARRNAAAAASRPDSPGDSEAQSTLPEKSPPETIQPPHSAPPGAVDPAPQPTSVDGAAPRAGRRRKRTRTSARRAVEHDAEA